MLPPSRGPKTYAEVVSRGRSSPEEGASCSSSDTEAPDKPLIGKPRISLPLSQLALGRTTPPWNARAWKRVACDIRDDFDRAHVMRVRIPGGCDFDAVPRCFPATDITLHYAVRFERRFAYGDGGVLPCVWPGCTVRWSPDGRLAVWPRRVDSGSQPTTDSLALRGRGAWNDVVVRVRTPATDDAGATKEGIVSLCVNGLVTTSPWRAEVATLKGVSFVVRGHRNCGGGLELADCWLV